MNKSITYLVYVAWLAPFLVPITLAISWRDRWSRKISVVVVGTLIGFGIIFVSSVPLGFLLGWLNRVFGLDAREQWESRAWFNAVFMLSLNISATYFATVFLKQWMGKDLRAPSERQERE